MDGSHFQAEGVLDGHRVLLIDDTFASGASLFDAYEALSTAGATVIGPLVIGRHVNVSGWPPSMEMMTWLRGRP